MTGFTEPVVEDAALAWLQALGYSIAHGPEIAPGELAAECIADSGFLKADGKPPRVKYKLRARLSDLLNKLRGL